MPKRDTPEREVKRKITVFLDSLQRCYYRMHVPFGYGKKSIDYEGCINGRFFGIEAKSPDNDAKVTPLQRDTLIAIVEAGGGAFIVSTDEGLNAFKRWAFLCFSNR